MILQWAGLRHAVPGFLKGDSTSAPLTSPSFVIHSNVFDAKKKKSKDYYSLLVTEKAQPPNIIHKWKSDFNLSVNHLREHFLLYLILLLQQIYSTHISSKLVTEQKMYVLFVRPNQNLCTISFTNALTQGYFETERLNLIGAFYQISKSVFLFRMFHLVYYVSNALQIQY